MNYKPDEATLISWMYGDIDEATRAKVDQYFAEHPEALKSIRQLQSARDVMAHIADKEVIAPPVIMEDSARVVPLWRSGWFRAAASIAASFILILVAGKILGPDVSYANGELRISFNGQAQAQQHVQPQQEGITTTQVQRMIDASVKGSEERVGEQIAANQTKYNELIRKSVQSTASTQMDTLVRQISRASEGQIQVFVAGLREENLRLMRQYLELSASEQRTYMENLLVDFSKWQQEQRSQDLMLVQTRVASIEQNTNQLKQETEQILASLIATGGITGKNSN
jgi:hypothetical protein